MKKLSTLILRNSLLLFATLFTISSLHVAAQTSPQAATPTKAVARITQAIDEANLVTLGGGVHPAIHSPAALDQGVVADSLPMSNIVLDLQRSPAQETALRGLLDSQQSKGSGSYHAWLTPAQFAAQFGVADADIQTVSSWLAQKGFTNITVPPGSMFIQFSGTAGLIRTAFHTEIHSFLINGQKHVANVSNPQIPAALAPVIAKVHSLHNFQKKAFYHEASSVQQAKAKAMATGAKFTYANVCPNPPDGTQACAAVGPADLATIYHIPATVAGSPAGQGQTVAIVARSNITISDINQFGTAFGIPNLASFSTNNVIVNGPDPGIIPGDTIEATLDVSMVGSAAPNANILLVVNGGTLTGNLAGLSFATGGTDGVDQSALYIVTNNLAPVMTESFGSCEQFDDTLFDSTLWEQAAAQGITVMVSTGDSGSAGCDPDPVGVYPNASDLGLQVSGTASTPFNVAVGGTDFNDASNPSTYWNATNGSGLGSAKGYIPEIPWNGSCASAATATTLNMVCATIDPTTSPDTVAGQGLIGGSGGQSSCGLQDLNNDTCTGYPKPSWQSAPGVPADSVRDLPDVSLFAAVNTASNNFYVICVANSDLQNGQPCSLTGENLNFFAIGGTSASSPAFAGIMALVNQSEIAAGRGGRQGNANYVLYKLATAQGTSPGTSACAASTGTPNSACTFNDITIGNNSQACVGSYDFQNSFGLSNTPGCSTQALNAVGVLIEPSSPSPFSATTPAWTATAGYDLATGLGSVNASNLIANWGTVTTNFKAATPAITSPASGTVNITHGNSQAFTITVTGSGSTPTGDVSLIAEPPGFSQVGVGSGTLSNGTVTITTNMLPGDDTTGVGTPYPIIAHYAGDGTFGPADSQPINVTVNRENSTTTKTLYTEDIQTGFLNPATSIQYGTNYIMIVDVIGASASGQICNNSSALNPNQPSTITEIPTVPCPTGTITLTNNGQPLKDFVQTGAANVNTSSVSNLGFVEDFLIQLLGGSNAIVANYSGDNSYNSSSSTNAAITVTPAPTQTSVTINGLSTATVASGQTVSLVATVATGYTQPCGQMQPGQTPPDVCQSVSNGVGPTGTVTFSSCGTAGSCSNIIVVPTAFNTGTGAGAFATATLNTSFTANATISATYSGDTNYAAQTGSTPLTLTVSGSVGAAHQLAFVTQPSNEPVSVDIAPAVQVAVEDINGNIITGATNTVSLTLVGTGTLGGTLTATPVKGIATFSNLTVSAVGTDTLTASSTGLTSATSTSFLISNPAAKLVFTSQPSNTAVGAAITPAVAVAVEDVNGNIVTGAASNIAIAIGTNPGSGSLGGVLTATPVNGIATFSNLTISAAGTGYTLTASTTGGVTSATSSSFNITSTATQLVFTVQPSTTVAGKSIAPAVQVAIEDAHGNIVAGASGPITIAIGTNPASGTLSGTTTVNSVLGVATFSNLSINMAGTGYTLAASSSGLTSATSTAFNITSPPAAKLAYTVQPTNVAVGASITPAVVVAVEDASGNVDASATNPVTIAITTGTGSGTLGGTLTATPVAGLATFSNLTISAAGTGYTLTATATGLTSAVSSAFNVTASTPTKLAFNVQPSNVGVGASITPAVVVAVENASGNVVTSASNPVTIAITTGTGSGTLGGTLTATPVAGLATFSNLTVSAVGTGYTLTATATGLTSAVSSTFNVTSAGTFAITYPASPTVLVSSSGASVNTLITVTPANGFTGGVVVTAGTLPPGVTCPNSPLTITVTAGAATGNLACQVAQTSSTLMASNAAFDQMLQAKTTPTLPVANGWWALSASTGFATLFLIFIPGGRKRLRAALGLGLLCLLSFSLGCSNNGSPVVTKTATKTVMTVNADKEPSTTAFMFSVAVTGGTPTGMVQLFDGATAIGTPASVSNGTAAPTAPALSVGTHVISAHYLGDSTTAASSSGTLNLTSTGSTTIVITTAPQATPVASPLNITVN